MNFKLRDHLEWKKTTRPSSAPCKRARPPVYYHGRNSARKVHNKTAEALRCTQNRCGRADQHGTTKVISKGHVSRGKKRQLLRQQLVVQSAVLCHRHNLEKDISSQSTAPPELLNEKLYSAHPNAELEHDYSDIPVLQTKYIMETFSGSKDFLDFNNILNKDLVDWRVDCKNGGTERVFDLITQHINSSHTIQKTICRQAQLPNESSVAICLDALVEMAKAEECYRESLSVIIQVLTSAIFEKKESMKTDRIKKKGEASTLTTKNGGVKQNVTYWDETERLRKENYDLRQHVLALEARISTLNQNQKNTDHDQDSFDLFIETLASQIQKEGESESMDRLIDHLASFLNANTLLNIVEHNSISNHNKEIFKKLYLQRIAAKNIPSAIEELLGGESETESAKQLLEVFKKNPSLEASTTIVENSIHRIQKLWEVHSSKLFDLFWLSKELVPELVATRSDVCGKILEEYLSRLQNHQVKTEKHKDSRRRTSHLFVEQNLISKHKTVLYKIMGRIAKIDPSFIQDLIVQNRQVIRHVLENEEVGEELISSLCRTSFSIAEKVLISSSYFLPMLFQKHLSWLNDLIIEHPLFLLRLAQVYPKTIASVLQYDLSLTPKICAALPELLEETIKELPSLIGFMLKDNDILFLALQDSTKSFLINGYVSRPGLLLENENLLQELDLCNIKTHRNMCKDLGIQTMPVRTQQLQTGIKPRPIHDLVGKRKLKAGTAWSKEEMDSFIANIYQRKMIANEIDDKAGHPREPLTEVINDYFGELDPIQEKRGLGNLIATVKKHADTSPSIFWFGVMTGCIKPEWFNPQSYEFFFMMLYHVFPAAKVEEALKNEQVIVPIKMALEAVTNAIDILWSDSGLKDTIRNDINCLEKITVSKHSLHSMEKPWAALNESLQVLDRKIPKISEDENVTEAAQKAAQKESSKGRKSSKHYMLLALKSLQRSDKVECVIIQEVIFLVLKYWFEADQNTVQRLIDLYRRADSNGDGTLDIDEFRALVSMVDPYCDDRTVKRMFRMTGETTDDGEQTITPMEFVQVMRSHNFEKIAPDVNL